MSGRRLVLAYVGALALLFASEGAVWFVLDLLFGARVPRVISPGVVSYAIAAFSIWTYLEGRES